MAGSDKERDEQFHAENDRDDTWRDEEIDGRETDGADLANDDDEPLETDRLALEDENERLPWLDSDDDDEYESSDSGRILGLTLLGLVALGSIVGGVWWATHRTPDQALVADGSLVTAPAQPYKEAPKSPGGKTFEGTGDTAFAVSEGQSRPAKLGEAGASPAATPAPAVDLGKKPPVASAGKAALPAASASAAPAAQASAAPAAQGPVVQVGAYSTRAIAEAAWTRLSGQHSALSGQRHQVLEGKADIGTVYRLQVVTSDAHGLCGRPKASGLACQVK